LPARLKDLIEQSLKLQDRVLRLDRMLDGKQLPAAGDADHPLLLQLSRLKAAFGSERD
jgi:regulator of CtrA degradation